MMKLSRFLLLRHCCMTPLSLHSLQSQTPIVNKKTRGLASGPKVYNHKHTTFTDYVFNSITLPWKRPAMIDYDTGESLTFEELEREIENVSVSLHHRDIGQGDVVTYFGTNRIEIIHLLCACGRIGAILSLANAQLTRDELVMQMKLSSTKILFTSPDCSKIAVEVTSVLNLSQGPYVIGKSEGCLPFDGLKIDQKGNNLHIDQVKPDEPLLLPFSSGTTGLPKGVMLSHNNLIAELNALRHPQFLPMNSPDDVSVCALPMVHIAGLVIGTLNALSQGATTVLLHRFAFRPFLEAIQRHRGTFALTAPPVMTMLAKDAAALDYDLTSLTTLFCGAAPLDGELTRLVSDKLNLDCIRQGYGMTETSPATHVSPVTGWKLGSVGVPLPNTECKIIDVSNGNQLGVNEEGELWVRGPQVMLGYHDNDEANSRVFAGDGWLRTGDIGYFDEDGHYFISDRLKDIINYKGYQIAPAYLESVLLSNQSVHEVAVFGVIDDNRVEMPRAWVKLKERTSLSRQEQHVQERMLQTFVNERVAPYKRLRGGIRLVEEIPKSASGKLLRRAIRDIDLQNRDKNVII